MNSILPLHSQKKLGCKTFWKQKLWLWLRLTDWWPSTDVKGPRQNLRWVESLSGILVSQNHRMAWIGRDLKDHESPTPLQQARLPTSISNTRSGCPGPHPPGLEHLQGRGSHNLSGQPVPAPHYSHSKELPLISNLNLPSFNLKPFPNVLGQNNSCLVSFDCICTCGNSIRLN